MPVWLQHKERPDSSRYLSLEVLGAEFLEAPAPILGSLGVSPATKAGRLPQRRPAGPTVSTWGCPKTLDHWNPPRLFGGKNGPFRGPASLVAPVSHDTQETASARRFIHAMLRPRDQMNLIEFATDVHQLTDFTNKASLLDRALDRLRPDFATALYDAVGFAAKRLATREGRKVLVLVSDGGDTASSATYADALEEALRGEVMVYSIIDVPIEASAGRELGGEHALITLAEQTGGKSFYVADGGLDKAFERVSDDLRTQYLLGYYPKNQEPGKSFHRIHVSIPHATADSFNVRHKTGYFAGEPTAPHQATEP